MVFTFINNVHKILQTALQLDVRAIRDCGILLTLNGAIAVCELILLFKERGGKS